MARTGLAIIAVLALLVQFTSVQVAMAAPAKGQTIEICTGHGTEVVTLDGAADTGPARPCGHCEHAVAPSLAGGPPAGLASELALYASVIDRTRPRAADPHAARAFPRPLGQGPPSA